MKTHTIFTQDLIEISLESREEMDILLELVKDKVENKKDLRTHIFSIICELIWLNSRIMLLLKRDLQNLNFKDKEEKEVILPEKVLEVLLSLVLAKSQAKLELNDFSVSLSLH